MTRTPQKPAGGKLFSVNTPCSDPLRRPCACCGGVLSAHQAATGSTCDRHACRHQAALQAIADRNAHTQTRLMADATRRRDQVARRLKLAAANTLPVVLVPANTRRLTLLSADRRRQFREHIEAVATTVAASPAASQTPHSPAGHAHAVPRSEPAVASAACAVCRGNCCLNGGVTAYINAETLRRWVCESPFLKPADIVRAYVSRLPVRSVKDSCVFHGGRGCNLPKPMRSAICNDYQCEGLQRVISHGARQMLIAASADGKVIRSAVLPTGQTIPDLPGTPC